MFNLAAAVVAIDFIEDHLQSNISVADIADAAYCSVYHFCRVFNQVVRHTPYDYLMRRRLSESARELVESDKKIIDIAFDYQFNNHETFSRAFKRMFGVQPNQYRKQACLDRRFLMSRLTPRHIEYIHQSGSLRPTLEEMLALRIAGVMSLVKADSAPILELWDMLDQEWAQAGDRLAPGDYYGLVYYPSNWETHGFFYMAGREIPPQAEPGPGLAVKAIPAMTYARFTCTGPAQELQLTRDAIYQTWLPQSGYRPACSLELEAYGAGSPILQPEQAPRQLYIPITL